MQQADLQSYGYLHIKPCDERRYEVCREQMAHFWHTQVRKDASLHGLAAFGVLCAFLLIAG
ncbi:MAG: hypothetical protein JXR94_09500 [Candidatus Hydrogenedentes bacterium]|nr:hypothetical protein [Candidatus Hydrogenedentota bacterium]